MVSGRGKKTESAQNEQRLQRDEWDRFLDPPKTEIGSSAAAEKKLELPTRILKLVVVLMVFSIVLGSGVISQGTAIFMAAQLAANITQPYCNKALGKTKYCN